MRPPANRDHEYAFKTIAITWLIITAIFTIFVWRAQMDASAPDVPTLRVPQ
jgi:hypothetical protein